MNRLHEDLHAMDAAPDAEEQGGDERGRRSRVALGAMVAIACVLFAFVYAPFDVGVLAMLAVAPVALTLLDPAVRCTPRAAAGYGLAFGWVAALMIVGPWMFSAASQYFEKPAWFAAAFTLGINLVYVGLFYAGLFPLIRVMAGAGVLASVVATASLWTAFEWFRVATLGNAWALLGQGLYEVPMLREAASAGGIWLLTWGCALCGAAIGVAARPGIDRRQRRLAIDLALAAPVLLVVAAYASRPTPASRAILPLRVAAVQAEIASNDLWDPALRMANLQRHLELTRTLKPGHVDLIVWPENAVPFLLDADAGARNALSETARGLGAPILLGGPRSEAGAEGTARFHNSAWFFAADGSVSHYDKMHLLPYIETMPALMPGSDAAAEYDAGRGPVLFEAAGWRIAPLICLEAIYPGYARAAATAGADLLVNISNDAWFGAGYGPEQHFAMSTVRASESRRPMIRVANGGISGAIGSRGGDFGPRIRRSQGVQVYEVYPANISLSPFHRFGDWVAYLSIVLAAVLCGRAAMQRRAQ